MAKNNKSAELHVIWLNLENAYGSVRHQLLEKAKEFFWIPEDIKNLISAYFKCTYVRFSNYKYSTNWQKLNIGIMMGCYLSATFCFVNGDDIALYWSQHQWNN